VTLFGSLQMIKSVLPHLKAGGGGSIVNVSTMETRKPLAAHGGYAVPKSALNGATRQLAVELGKYKIRVNTAVMGWMWGAPVEGYVTGMAGQMGTTPEAMIAGIAANIPLGHIPPDEECAKTILTLLSDYASQVTGTAIEINGGEYVSL
jgi:NAD(P)-dependent dehydrogenase (short-subunit alcohol dehydrogenase family)